MNVGIIGCGNICTAYLQNAKKFDNIRVTRLADLDVTRAEALATEHGVPHHGTVEDLLGDDTVELVINLTIPLVHAKVALQILEAGKHVYGEKPLAAELDEAEAVLALAAEKNLRVGNAPDTFLGTSHQTVRKLLADGAIGQPTHAIGLMLSGGPESWHPDPEFFYKRGGGPMFDMGPYYLTAFMNLLGPIRSVSAEVGSLFEHREVGSGDKAGQKLSIETEDHFSASLRFDGNMIGTLITSFASQHHPFDWKHPITVFGTNGTIQVPDPNNFEGEIRVRTADADDWEVVPDAFSHPNGRSLGVSDMIEAIRNDRPTRCDGRLAQQALRVMHASRQSSEEGRRIDLPGDAVQPALMPDTFWNA